MPYFSCFVVTVHERVGDGIFVVTPLGCKNVYYPGNQVTVIFYSMPAQPLGSFFVFYGTLCPDKLHYGQTSTLFNWILSDVRMLKVTRN